MAIPVHVAFIMDGNGRWAKKKGLERIEGHRKGAEVADAASHWCADLGIRYVTLYAFSTENWRRPKEEVEFLFELMLLYIGSKVRNMLEEGVRMRFMGRLNELPPKLGDFVFQIENKTSMGKKLDVIVALNYGGRAEIVDAVNEILKIGKEQISEEDIAMNLYLPDVPEPDLIIRTSGEERLSNFLTWQSVYSELFFTGTLWPDFTKEEFHRAVDDYSKRKRRFGALD
ncbi:MULTISPECIES: polyprenyl diphosphate synthase [Mesotoga]|jgi:undecaprenyl diphosphate synthase|uniref:polyprenyl diphosphate synthase n=1 Tax=Mesotoga TaxID=1184396 RepID=UPI0002CC1B2D|nr:MULTISPECIES: polyprenyl diphosphate synthase [Mesotoga]MCP5461098.1 di-trans,poly-cis-decaprenylcistransferase [Thermotogota bacterium]CCU84248.1 Undecaprenyl pyrophosphate synthase [Mesotoga infera]HNQ70908.1 polyprenyl diphosphate synthase [Mesotoga prima]HNS75676.1 polyprenyl diphosphate synthase [Mesotoga prima]HOP37717.1 polyprenyl diphosphate synthase [Mesotoga prima]